MNQKTQQEYIRPKIVNWAHPNGKRAYFNWNGSVGGVSMAGPVAVFGPLSNREPFYLSPEQIRDILVDNARKIEDFITDGHFRDSLVIHGWQTNEGALLATIVTRHAEAVIDKIFAQEGTQSRDTFMTSLSKEGRVIMGYFLVLHTEEVSHYRVLEAIDSL